MRFRPVGPFMKCKRVGCDKEVKENPYRGVNPLFCSVKCKNIFGVNTLRRRRKLQLIKMLGGVCFRCGYGKSPNALQFHHRDPSNKKFTLNMGVTLSLERVVEELAKCELICANCHAELHFDKFL